MANINLLPWRDALRKEKLQEFFIILGIFVGITLVIFGGIHYYHVQLIEHQQFRNRTIEDQLALLDKKIKEIQELESEKQRLLDRMRAIEQLQGNRPLIVRFFDELLNKLPEGVSIVSITQKGSTVTIIGEAQSSARVSSFMRNLDESDWLANAKLNIITSTASSGTNISSFTLRIKQVIPKPPEEDV